MAALRASGDLDDYLQFHARRELVRNHLDYLDHFDDDELLDLLDLRKAA